MARSIWKGAITFGMLSIPVKLYTATETKDVAFHTMHMPCKSRLKQKRWCPTCTREVFSEPAGDIGRVYEYTKEQYVEITDADLAELPLPSLHTISLETFVRASEIDPIQYEKTYWLEPEDVGKRPYVLLLNAIGSKGVVGLGKLTLRQKEALVAVRAHPSGILLVESLFWPDEVRELPKPIGLVATEQEQQMANMLVDAFLEPFNASKYHDDYRLTLLERIEAKRAGNAPPVVASAAPAGPPVPDLMAMLKASIEQAKSSKTSAA